MTAVMTDPLVSTAWLADHLGDPDVTILDASWFMPDVDRHPAIEYAAGHIPGAVRFDIDFNSDHMTLLPHMLSPPDYFATAMRRRGVNADSTVIVYDSLGLFSAPRVWWNLRAMGHSAVAVLDGGMPRWVAEGRPLESGWRDSGRGEFKSRPVPSLVADLEAVRQALETGSARVVDARPAARFQGVAPEPRPGLRAGHMPGAVNTPWTEVVDDGVLRPPEALREVFTGAGVDLAAPIITTCGSGISASLLALALARLGRYDVAVYDGSWTEWGGRSDTPVVTGP